MRQGSISSDIGCFEEADKSCPSGTYLGVYEYFARLSCSSCSRADEKSPIGHTFRNMRTTFPSLKRAKTTEAHS